MCRLFGKVIHVHTETGGLQESFARVSSTANNICLMVEQIVLDNNLKEVTVPIRVK